MKRKQKHLGETWKWKRMYNLALFIIFSLLFVACSPFGESSKVVPDPTKATHIETSPEPTEKLSSPTLTSTSNRQVPQIIPGDWPGYLLDNSSFNSKEATINLQTAPQLRVYWKYDANGGVTAQPVVVNDTLYWGSWDGLEHATTLDGKEIWATNLGETTDHDPDCDPSSVGVASTAAIVPMSIGGKMTLVDFVGGGDATFYALNAANGHIIWKTPLRSASGDFIWSSPAVYKGSIYVGVASFGDCPGVQGKLVRLNAETGAIRNTLKVVPDGCAGGPIWSSPTIDRSTGEIYISTGNFSSCSTTEGYAEALMELHASNLAVVGSWQVPPSDQVFDGDFGSTPTLFNATINGVSRPMVGTINKNGIYYAFIRGAISAGPAWRAQISWLPRCSTCEGPGNISPAAWDGSRLYIAGANTTINGAQCQGDVRAVDPATGKFIWERCFPDARAMAPIAGVPGIVVVGEGQYVNVLDATSGKTLFVYQDRMYGSVFYGAPSIAHGILFIGNIDGNLFAFKYYRLPIH
jgi:outer membrane protein assembly factor BamB